MNLTIRINLDDTHFEDDLENVMEQIQWHLERKVRKNFNLVDAAGETVGSVEVME